jgi:hypothetical protein
MKKISVSRFFIFSLFTVIIIAFFHPVFLKSFIPFPGDLLLAEYQPWRSTSFNNIMAGAVPNKAQYFDTLRQLYPWKTYAIDAIKNGIFPLWNPHNFSGTPLFANFQSAILFPLNLFYLVFPQYISWTILIILQPLLCLVAVYCLSRIYGLSKTASVFASISYAFCLYMTAFLEYNIMGHFMYLLPFALLSIELIIKKKTWAYLLLTASITLSALAGHTQLFAGIIFYTLLYSAIRSFQINKTFKKRLLFFLSILFFIILGIGIAGIQLLPGMELIIHSARSPHVPEFFYNNLLIKPSQFVLYFVPDLFGNPANKNYLVPFSYPSKAIYVGLTALFLMVVSFFSKSKSQFWKAILISTITVSLIVFLNPVSFLFYKLNLPLISSSSPSNFIFMVSLGLCLLAGFGIDELRKHHSKKPVTILISFWVIMVGIFLITFMLHTPIVRNNLIYSFLVLFALTATVFVTQINKKTKSIVGILLILIALVDLFYFFHKFNSFVPSSYMYPKTAIEKWLNKNTGINRFWGYSYAGIEPNFATQLGLYSPDGYDPLYPKEYGELIQSASNGIIPKEFNERSRSDALIPNGFGKTDMTANPYRLKILSLLGVKYILDKTENGSTLETFPSDLFEKIASVDDFNVLEYKKAAPRFFLTDSYQLFSSKDDFTDKLFNSNFDPTNTILLNEDPKIKNTTRLTTKNAKLISYKPNFVSIKTDTNTSSMLYLSDTYYPGWNAYIDGLPTKIYKANYAFRAVLVPKGVHKIEFKYQPISFAYGMCLSILSIIVTMFTFVIIKKKTNE